MAVKKLDNFRIEFLKKPRRPRSIQEMTTPSIILEDPPSRNESVLSHQARRRATLIE